MTTAILAFFVVADTSGSRTADMKRTTGITSLGKPSDIKLSTSADSVGSTEYIGGSSWFHWHISVYTLYMIGNCYQIVLLLLLLLLSLVFHTLSFTLNGCLLLPFTTTINERLWLLLYYYK
jgi:hypothetical protein